MMPLRIIRNWLIADDYVAVSSFSRNGFARNEKELSDLQGQEIQRWGFADHSNLSSDQLTYYRQNIGRA